MNKRIAKKVDSLRLQNPESWLTKYRSTTRLKAYRKSIQRMWTQEKYQQYLVALIEERKSNRQ